jgi:hypothetical protein
MLTRVLVAGALLVLVAGCSRATLPYTPVEQPSGAKISAAYQLAGDKLRIEIDTDGQRLEQVWIYRADGTAVAPEAIDNAPVVRGPGPTIGVGVGGGTWGGRGGFGSGVGVGIPIGGGSSRIEGNSIASFDLGAAGPAPWQVYVKLAGIDPATIVVGGPPAH